MSRTLAEVLLLLERMAPLHLAAEWDNVGLLLEPSGAAARPISRVFLCIDLSGSVLAEALAESADFIVSYHPPLFKGYKRLRASSADERVVVRAIEEKIPVYSPHTALDAAAGGVNDWLARAFGPGKCTALAPYSPKSTDCKLVIFVPRSHVNAVRSALARELGAGEIGDYTECSFELEGKGSFFGNEASTPHVGTKGKLEFAPEVRLEMRCPLAALKDAAHAIKAHHPYEEPAWDVYPLVTPAHSGVGEGRLLELATPLSLEDAVARLKVHLDVSALRVASSAAQTAGSPIARVAVCAGAGGGVFEHVTGVDLFVTGEMRHHDVLAKLRNGASVILSEHTHTERGFLPEFARRFTALAGGEIEVIVSERDADPLLTV